ncbi:MAG TPA: hypothetical protein VGF43_02625 [Dongiaceae bacterium]
MIRIIAAYLRSFLEALVIAPRMVPVPIVVRRTPRSHRGRRSF